MKSIILTIASLLIAATVGAQQLPQVAPEKVGLSSSQLDLADNAIEDAVARGEIPGAVLAVVRHGKIARLKAYGNRQLVPETVRMTENTIFDLASCTKPLATATSTLILVERGKLRLIDAVSDYIPDFENWRGSDGHKHTIRIIDLMTHTSGLPAYVSEERLQQDFGEASGRTLMQYICSCTRLFEPETDFRYSCLNYITLQQIVEQVSGMSLREFARQNIFAPLGMNHTDYIPCRYDADSDRIRVADLPCWADSEPAWNARIAPAEKLENGQLLCGINHDPLARDLLGGVSGNAGLFSTADDIALFCTMLLEGGCHDGVRILSPLAVQTMCREPRATRGLRRTPGWDIGTAYGSCCGDLFSDNTFSHTGSTGTSIVIDPDNDIAVILLTNCVHPAAGHSVVHLRSLVANTVAAAVTD